MRSLLKTGSRSGGKRPPVLRRSFSWPAVLLLVLVVAGRPWGLAPATAVADTRTDLFTAGNERYAGGDFEGARKAYEELVRQKQFSANVFFNLGNTEYRLGNPGRALLHYERALALDPHHPEARANLAFVRGRTGAKLPPRRWTDSLFASFRPATFVWIGSIAGWWAVFCLVVAVFRRGRRPGLFAQSLVALVVCGYGLQGVWRSTAFSSLHLVVSKETQARFAPADTAKPQLVLPAGSHVHVLETRGAWSYCLLPDGTRGWVLASDIERVKIPAS